MHTKLLPVHLVRRLVAAFVVLATVAMGLVAATPPPAVNAAEPAAAASAVQAAVAHLTPSARTARPNPQVHPIATTLAAAHPAALARTAPTARSAPSAPSAPSVRRSTSPRPRESAGEATSARLVARPAATPSADATPGTFDLGPATVDLLANTLSIPVGSGTLSGTVDGSTFTATVSGPTAPPIALPNGYGDLTFGDSSISIDTSTRSLTLTTSATAGDATAELDVTVPNVTAPSGVDLHLQLGGLAVLGVPLDFDGHLSVAKGHVAGSLTATVSRDVTIAGGALTLHGGSTFTLDSEAGLTAQAAASIGGVEVTLAGAVAGARDWNLAITSTGTKAWSPGAGLSFTPNFSGSLTSVAGHIDFDLQANQALSWATSGPTFDLNHVELSNLPAPASLACPVTASTGGHVWFAGTGTLTIASTTVDASGCIDLTGHSFHLASEASGAIVSDPSFSIDHLAANVSGDLAAKSVAFSGNATLHVTGAVHATLTIGVTYSGGTLVAGVRLSDPASLGFGPNDSGAIYVATSPVKDLPLDTLFPGTLGTVDLVAGVTAAVSFHVPSDVKAALSKMGITVDTVDATASLGTDGFDLKAAIKFAPALHLLPAGSDTRLDLTRLAFELHLGVATTVSVSADASLHIPSLMNGAAATDVNVSLVASLSLPAPTFTLGITLTGLNGAPWVNAFGIPGMEVGSLAASIGIGSGLPVLAISATNVKLPPAAANALGLSPTANVSLQLNTDPGHPILAVSLDPGSQGWALKPLTIATQNQSVRDSFRIDRASLRFAPSGGTINNIVVPAGVGVRFAATILGTSVTVDAQVDLTALKVHADIEMGKVIIATGVEIPGAKLKLDISPTGFAFLLQGGFTDRTTNTGFSVNVTMSASPTLANGAIDLHVTSGLPSYLQVSGALTGTIQYSPSSGLSFTAHGYGSVVIGGSYFGSVDFTYSSSTGAFWKQISGSATSVATAMKNFWGSTSSSVTAALNQLHWDQMSTVNALSSSGFSDFATSIRDFFHPKSKYIWNADAQVLDVEYASKSVNARVVQYLWNGGANQKWLWIPLPNDPLGYGELVSVNSGMCLSVVSFSTIPGAGIVQGPCVGHDAQLFRFEDAGGGYSNIKNRQTGYVLDIYNASLLPQTPLVQWYRNGTYPWNQRFYTTDAII